MKTLGQAGENALLEHLARTLSRKANVVEGPGDDCAVVRPAGGAGYDWLLTSDSVVENVHFVTGTRPEALGHKAAGRALSDLAAMGGDPEWLLVNLTLPSTTSVRYVDRFYKGFQALAQRHGGMVAGGDLSAGTTVAIHVFAVGRVPQGRALLRSGAGAGDVLFVTGALGDSLRGRHLSFEPRLQQGRFLRRWATALMDVSDGLASDVPRLAARSGVGAHIDEDAVPVAPSLARYRRRATRLRHALCDGEDYELLFAVPARRTRSFLQAWRRRFALPCTAIGSLTPHAGEIRLRATDGGLRRLATSGYAHFDGSAA